MNHRLLRTVPLIAAVGIAAPAPASTGQPVAIRWWGQSFVTIETTWGLTIAIDPYALKVGYDDPHVEADLVLVTHDHFDHNNVGIVAGKPRVLRGLDAKGQVRVIDHVLDRRPNIDEVSVEPSMTALARSEHAARIRSIESFHDDQGGAKRGRNAMFLIEVDGLRILHCGDLGQARLTDEQVKAIGYLDVCLIPVGGVYTCDGLQAAAIIGQVRPAIAVPIHYKTDALTVKLRDEREFIASLPVPYARVDAVGNTVAARQIGPTESVMPTAVVLRDRPWQMPEELEALFQRMEAAARDSREVFRALSVEQLNHRPSDGTHTPRWNAEHMMGRQLGFFSSVYHAIDPMVTRINLNPKQMPEDYQPAHPDWTGAEEARQIERAGAFARRFAFLLAGKDLDEKIEGSPWPLRGLLEQMERHYREHTANVKKKFSLPDWPAGRE